MPKVSVLTPIYNTEPEHLRQAIESILNQTFTDFEFIILNDRPWNTEIEDIVLAYKDARIKYVKNDKNIGISKSRNKLLSLASGEYLAIFDHDDISLPTRLEKQVDFLDKNPMVGVVSSNTEWFPGHHKTNHPSDNLEIKKHLMFADVVDILNVKCDPGLYSLLDKRDGILRGYHMGGTWVSILLDGSVERNQIYALLDNSYKLVATKYKKQEVHDKKSHI